MSGVRRASDALVRESRSLWRVHRPDCYGIHMLVDPHKTFDALLVHEANRGTLRAVKRAVSHGSRRPGPLLLVGPGSTGKTHLMHAAANHVLLHDPARRVQLLSGESFTRDLMDDIRKRGLHVFRSRFSISMTLLVDAVEDLERWSVAEDELERTMHAVISRGGNVVLTMSDDSDEHVARMTSRIETFERGEVLQWRRAPIDLRVTAMSRVLRAQRTRLPASTLKTLARASRSVPEATAAVHRALLARRPES